MFKWPFMLKSTHLEAMRSAKLALEYAESNVEGEALYHPTYGCFLMFPSSGEKLKQIVDGKGVALKQVMVTKQHGRWCSNGLDIKKQGA